jgi:hypothetical protein
MSLLFNREQIFLHNSLSLSPKFLNNFQAVRYKLLYKSDVYT